MLTGNIEAEAYFMQERGKQHLVKVYVRILAFSIKYDTLKDI